MIENLVKRERNHEWPEHHLIEQVFLLERHVVAVSNKHSSYSLTEWRICYIKAEIMLVNSFSESQTKLKLISKSILKPLCLAITSYNMKNINFWEIETNPSQRISQYSLIDRLIDAILFQQQALKSDYLENYMIAERNLFQGCISDNERKKLKIKLDELVNERQTYVQAL